MATINQKKVVVVGSGLAGMIAALTLQKSGYAVVLLDKRPQVGGLCGTFTMDGHQFVIACNDFGSGLVALLQKLGVKQAFEYKKSSVFYRNAWFNAGPDVNMLLQLRHEWKNIASLIGGILMQQLPNRQPQSIEAFVDRYTQPGAVNDLAKLIAYFMGVAPYDIQTSYFGLDSEFNYGYTKMACPVGGPQALSDSIAETFIQQGGQLLLDTLYQGHCYQNSQFCINTLQCKQEKSLEADYFIDTTVNNALYPPQTKRGLPLSMMCLAIKNTFEYPDNTHTLSYYEPDISHWFKALDNGVLPKNFGFHLFKNNFPGINNNSYTVNVYFYLPRGIEQLNEKELTFYKQYLLERIEKMLPRVSRHIIYSRIITAEDFKKMHGMSSRVMPYIHLDRKPDNSTERTGYFRAGHTVFPPGEHAGAAALSGYLVAQSIMTA